MIVATLQSPAVNAQAYEAITEVLGAYYEGLYTCDVAKLEQVFHPDARYVTASGEELLQLTMQDYFPIVAERTPPADSGDAYGYTIDEIALAGSDTAAVTMRSSMMGKHFTDFLTLVRVDDKWQIIAKVFHYEVED